jgi:hypothetical protein
MAKLEPWQRYRKASPCPVCGGYGAYKPENRCKGFLTADGNGAYCSQVDEGAHLNPESKWFDAVGMYLYWHPLEGQGQGEGEAKVGRHSILAMRHQGLLRRQARVKEARRPPTGKDFG